LETQRSVKIVGCEINIVYYLKCQQTIRDAQVGTFLLSLMVLFKRNFLHVTPNVVYYCVWISVTE